MLVPLAAQETTGLAQSRRPEGGMGVRFAMRGITSITLANAREMVSGPWPSP
jgi:hypothetical protein